MTNNFYCRCIPLHCRSATLTDVAMAHSQIYLSLLETSANSSAENFASLEFIATCMTEHSDCAESSASKDNEAVPASAPDSRHPDLYINKYSFQAALASAGSAMTVCDAVCCGKLIPLLLEFCKLCLYTQVLLTTDFHFLAHQVTTLDEIKQVDFVC